MIYSLEKQGELGGSSLPAKLNSKTFRKTKNDSRFLNSFLAGAAIGFGGILPGVSGSVMAVSFGLYCPMLDALAGLRRNFRANFLFLLPIGLGATLGIVVGAILLDRLLASFWIPLMYLFIGLIGGGIPPFLREANEDGFKLRYLLSLAAGAILASLLLLLEQNGPSTNGQLLSLTPFQSLVAGAIIAIGAIVPGISTSFILIYLGWYTAALAAISELQIITLVFVGLGALLFAILTIKIVRWLFSRYRGYAYYCVLGFLFVSIVLIFPGFSWDMTQLVSTVLLIFGFIAALILNRYLGQDSISR